MSKEEFEELNIGDHIWKFDLLFSERGTTIKNQIVEFEKIDSESFKVVNIIKGTSCKKGSIYKSYHLRYGNYFHTYNEGVEYWNSWCYNSIDRITSNYERAIKNIKNKLLRKEL